MEERWHGEITHDEKRKRKHGSDDVKSSEGIERKIGRDAKKKGIRKVTVLVDKKKTKWVC